MFHDHLTRTFISAFVLLCTTAIAQADGDRQASKQKQSRRNSSEQSNDKIVEQTKKIEEEAKQIGPWENQATIIKEANQNIFQRKGWTTESDQFALGLVNQISQVAPWDVKQREEIFMNSVQGRYGLTQDQRTLFQSEMRRESMQVTRKYFTDLVPIAMEMVQTRAKQEPFTAEQVQNWAEKLQPVLADGMTAVERISKKLEATMTPDQRKKLAADMKDVLKRQKAVEEMMVDWRAGKWNPTDWGLDNDPIHAAAMADLRQANAEKSGKVQQATAKNQPDFNSTSRDESTWEKYVRWFCDHYECTGTQRNNAQAILNNSMRQAQDYLKSRQKDIEQAQRLNKEGDTPAKRENAALEIQRLQKPIQDIFQTLCDRLEKSVLTSEQLAKKGPVPKASKAEQAKPKPVAETKPPPT